MPKEIGLNVQYLVIQGSILDIIEERGGRRSDMIQGVCAYKLHEPLEDTHSSSLNHQQVPSVCLIIICGTNDPISH